MVSPPSLQIIQEENIPKAPGIYTLLLTLETTLTIPTRGHNHFTLHPGSYVYAGSAQGQGSTSLAQRILRHLKDSAVKNSFWHIDYLLSISGPPHVCIYAETNLPRECNLNQTLHSFGGTPITKFGSSDCINSCKGHLTHFSRTKGQVLKIILEAFLACNLLPRVVSKVKDTSRGSKPFITQLTL